MTHPSWERRHRATSTKPGPLDLFVLTLIDGRRAALHPVTEYEEALAKARAFGADHKCQIKVLPMTGLEVRNLLGIRLPDAPETLDPVDRRLITDCLRDVICNSSDDDARRDAYDLLVDMGVPHDA